MRNKLLSWPTCLLGALWLVVRSPISAQVTITSTNYHGWTGSYVLRNPAAEVFVVPSVGRVMQFRLAGETNGPFWENPTLLGKPMMSQPWNNPGSFGGDKTWPAPQSAWNWPPPDVFDAVPLVAEVRGDTIRLSSPVSARFGIRTERTVSLDAKAARMKIVTQYEKISGESVEVGVWVITQTGVPEAAYLPIPVHSRFPKGLSTLWEIPSNQVTIRPGLVEFRRDAKDSHKIGNDAGSLAWIGSRWILRIDVGRSKDATYPDDGCSAELYSNPDPAGYVELETLGPLRKLSIGQSLSATNIYTLSRRQTGSSESEARRILGID
jgi:hypothetical protein